MKRLMIIALLLAFLELPALAKMTLYTTDDVNLRERPGQKYAKMDRAGRHALLRPAAVRTSGHRRALNERCLFVVFDLKSGKALAFPGGGGYNGG